MNKLEGLLKSNTTRKGHIEHHFTTFASTTIVFIDVKKNLKTTEKNVLNVKGQILAECVAMLRFPME